LFVCQFKATQAVGLNRIDDGYDGTIQQLHSST